MKKSCVVDPPATLSEVGGFQYNRLEPPSEGGSAILASPMVTIQAVVAMVTVPVAMVTGLVAMEI